MLLYILTLRYLGFQFSFLQISKIITSNLVLVSLKFSNYRAFDRNFKIAFQFPVLFNVDDFSVSIVA